MRCRVILCMAFLMSVIACCAWSAEEWIQADAFGKVFPAPATAPPQDGNRTVAGDLYVEPATLNSLGFQWNIQGDENRNGRVEVHYRPAGATEWRRGMDLLRIKGEIVHPTTLYTCGNLYAGSILFLDPGASYEVRLKLCDPDHADEKGVVAERVIRTSTKALPRKSEGGRVLHVYSAGHAGAREQPAFADAAAALAEAGPGDHIAFHAGRYTGSHVLTRSGTREKPLVIRAAGDGEVIFEGSGSLFNVSTADYVWIEGFVIRNYGWAVYSSEASRMRGLTVRLCRFEDCNVGVFTRSRHNRDVYVADNVFIGTKGSWHRHYPPRDGLPYKAVWMTGQGIDVCYNRIENHWDGLSVANHKPSEKFEEKLCAMDFYNNDVQGIVDDNEADYGQHNIRFFNNRLVDLFMGLSAQPVWGGPAYFVRNVQYNITLKMPFKLNSSPAGVLIYNNTCFSAATAEGGVAHLLDSWSNTHVYNNLFLGSVPPVLSGAPLDPAVSTLDYNGYSVDVPPNAKWGQTQRICWGTYEPAELKEKGPNARVRYRWFASLKDFSAATGYEKNHVAVSWHDFVNVTPPKGEAVGERSDPGDFRLKEGSAAVDRAKHIPNITDEFTGNAPDLGALEFGRPIPHYGPRDQK